MNKILLANKTGITRKKKTHDPNENEMRMHMEGSMLR